MQQKRLGETRPGASHNMPPPTPTKRQPGSVGGRDVPPFLAGYTTGVGVLAAGVWGGHQVVALHTVKLAQSNEKCFQTGVNVVC